MGVGAATFLGVAAPMPALAATMTLSNPAPGPSVALGGLPGCVDANIYPAGFYIGNSNGSNQKPAADLGWVGKPHIAVTDWGSGTQAEIVPQIPCTMVGEGDGVSEYLQVGFVQNVFGTNPPADVVSWAVDLAYTCLVNGSSVVVAGTASPAMMGIRGGVGVAYGGRVTGGSNRVSVAECPALQSVRMVVSTLVKGTASPYQFENPVTMIWQASAWVTTDGAWTPATSAATVVQAGNENPIVCNINNTGADIVAIIQNVVLSTVAWVPCMIIPAGWDRANKIGDAWTSGPVGTLVTAYKAAVPNGITCGAVGNIPFFGRTIGLDTCQADFAPGWIKVVVTYVMILGLGALAVRRIMWAVGSRG